MTTMRLLNIGCGSVFHPDWMNLDRHPTHPSIVRLDLMRGLPFPDATMDAVYHSHVLEHFDRETGRRFLGECVRVLRPGSILRIVVPDLEYSARLYLQCLEANMRELSQAAREHYEWAIINLIDQLVRDSSGGACMSFWQRAHHDPRFITETAGGTEFMECMNRAPSITGEPPRATAAATTAIRTFIRSCVPERVRRWRRLMALEAAGERHRWMYDRYALAEVLKEVGLTDVRCYTAHESGIPGFLTYHLDVSSQGDVRKPHSIFMEGRREWVHVDETS